MALLFVWVYLPPSSPFLFKSPQDTDKFLACICNFNYRVRSAVNNYFVKWFPLTCFIRRCFREDNIPFHFGVSIVAIVFICVS